jgi:hypothetical protein
MADLVVPKTQLMDDVVPRYLWRIIAGYMPTRELVRLESTCKAMQECFDEAFWRVRLRRDFEGDAAFFFAVDVPARLQYKEHVLYRVDPKVLYPYVMRVALVGPRAQRVSEELGGEKFAVQPYSLPWDFFYKHAVNNQRIDAEERLTEMRVGLWKKTFKLLVGTVRTKNLQYVEWGKVDCVLVCCDLDTTTKELDKLIHCKELAEFRNCIAVCGPAPKMEYDRTYAVQKELWGRYCEKAAILKQLNDELPEIEVRLVEEGVPYVCTDNPVAVLRCVLGELSFRLRVNNSLGKTLSRIGVLKQQKGIKSEPLPKQEEPEEHDESKCVVS